MHEKDAYEELPTREIVNMAGPVKLPEFVQEELTEFLKQGRPGSITFHSDGQAIRQAEVKTVRRDASSK